MELIVIDTTSSKKIWYNTFLEKYSPANAERLAKDMGEVVTIIETKTDSSPREEYKKLKALHRKKVIKSLTKDD